MSVRITKNLTKTVDIILTVNHTNENREEVWEASVEIDGEQKDPGNAGGHSQSAHYLYVDDGDGSGELRRENHRQNQRHLKNKVHHLRYFAWI